MSTLAAARADNFYYPPGWTPDKGGLNKFQGSHGALGARAKKLHLGILVIRFEMPYNCWCLGCGTHIAQGVRYNAEKKRVGKYFSTPIWEFSMKCHYCDQRFLIKTDPKNADYEFVSGVRKKIEEYSAEAAETIEFKDEDTAKKLATDPFYKLEHLEDDKRKAKSELDKLREIQSIQSRHEKDSDLNSVLRRAARAKRKAEAALLAEGKAKGFGFAMLPSSEEDAEQAKQDMRRDGVAPSTRFRHIERQRYRSLKDQSIFAAPRAAASSRRDARFGKGTAVKEEEALDAASSANKRQRVAAPSTADEEEGTAADPNQPQSLSSVADGHEGLRIAEASLSPSSSTSTSRRPSTRAKPLLPGLDAYDEQEGESEEATGQGVGKHIPTGVAALIKAKAAKRKLKRLKREGKAHLTKHARAHATKVAFQRAQQRGSVFS